MERLIEVVIYAFIYAIITTITIALFVFAASLTYMSGNYIYLAAGFFVDMFIISFIILRNQ